MKRLIFLLAIADIASTNLKATLTCEFCECEHIFHAQNDADLSVSPSCDSRAVVYPPSSEPFSCIVHFPDTEHPSLHMVDVECPNRPSADCLYLEVSSRVPVSRLNCGEAELRDILWALHKIPNGIRTLSLSNNDLSKFGIDGLRQIFDEIPKEIRSIDLSHTRLWPLAGGVGNIGEPFLHLPKDLQALNLSGNFVVVAGEAPPNAINDILQNIPQGIRCLNLANTEVITILPMHQISQLFSHIPRGIVHLSLSHDSLGNSLIDPRILQQLPRGIKYLDLRHNSVIFCRLNKFEAALANSNLASYLPPEVVKLDISGNNMSEIPEDALLNFLRHLPPTLEFLKLENDPHKEKAILTKLGIHPPVDEQRESLAQLIHKKWRNSPNDISIPNEVASFFPFFNSNAVGPKKTRLQLLTQGLRRRAFRCIGHVSRLSRRPLPRCIERSLFLPLVLARRAISCCCCLRSRH